MSNISVATTQQAAAPAPSTTAPAAPQADAVALELPEVQEQVYEPATVRFDGQNFIDGNTTTPETPPDAAAQPPAPTDQTLGAQPAQDAQAQANAQPPPAQETVNAPFYKSQAEVDEAFKLRLAGERRKYDEQNGPIISFGNDLLSITTNILGVPADQAYAALMDMVASKFALDNNIEPALAQRMISQELRINRAAQQSAQPQYQQQAQTAPSAPEAIEVIRQMLAVDPNFSPQILATNPEAQRALFTGQMTPRQVYDTFFRSQGAAQTAAPTPPVSQTPTPQRPVPERAGNSGLNPQPPGMTLTPEMMQRINEMVDAGVRVVL